MTLGEAIILIEELKVENKSLTEELDSCKDDYIDLQHELYDKENELDSLDYKFSEFEYLEDYKD